MPTSDTQAPTAPTGLMATTISASQINLSWTSSIDNVGVTAYKVYRGGTLIATLGNVTSYSDTGRTASTAYSYTVSACDARENCSAQSASASATTQSLSDTQAPTAPTGLMATPISASQINLSWISSSDNVGVTAYRVYDNTGWSVILGNVTSYSDTGLWASSTYRYTVLACDAAGNCSAPSAYASATTLALADTQAPTAPTGLMATTISASQINLSWTSSIDNVGVMRYEVYRGGALIATLSNVTSYSNTGLTASTAYSYTVSACDAAGNCSARSAPASATTPALLVSPVPGSRPTAVPVYRFFNMTAGGHFFTINEAEKNTVIQNYNWFRNEGIGFYAYSAQQPGTLPVYRFFNMNAGGHFFTVNEAEKNTVIQNFNWFRYEGIGFYAYSAQQSGTLPVYRFFNMNAGGHFFTINEAEKNTVIQNYNWFRNEATGFYAYPSP